jgi:hypothetical protein
MLHRCLHRIIDGVDSTAGGARAEYIVRRRASPVINSYPFYNLYIH